MLKHIAKGILLVLTGSLSVAWSAQPSFQPPAETTIPPGPLGTAIRQGKAIFDNTPSLAKPYVGNDLSCSQCHLDHGRRAGASPMWAAYVAYPAYRTKNHQVNTMQKRIQECFLFSENGHEPPQDGKIMTDLIAYTAWMAHGAPMGVSLPGRGYPKLPSPQQSPDPSRGQVVYQAHCAACHGADGQGLKTGNKTVFPPLWGPRSFNAGAGMAHIKHAAPFIKANMPFDAPGTLTTQQAYDVAAFIDHEPRPKDPRKRNHPN